MLTLKAVCEDGIERTLHSLYDPIQEAKTLAGSFSCEKGALIVVLGLGLGYHVDELSSIYPESDIVVIEPMPEILDAANKRGFIGKPKVQVLSGVSSIEAIQKVTGQQMGHGIRPVCVFSLMSEVSAFASCFGPVIESLKRITSVRLWDRLKYPKFKNEKLKVAVLYDGYFLRQEIANAIKALGHDVAYVGAKKTDTLNSIISKLTSCIMESRPDFLLTVNHLGFDEQGEVAAFLESIEMPAASWYVDSPSLVVGAFQKNVSAHVSIFLWDRSYMDAMKSMGFEHVHYLPLAADPSVFKPLKLSRRQAKDFACDVSFVGNSMVDPTKERLNKLPDALRPVSEQVAQDMIKHGLSYNDAIAKSADVLTGLDTRQSTDFQAAVIWRATLLYRLACVKKLDVFNARIHGDKGWHGLLSRGFDMRSTLSYYDELPLLYNATKVNFNATSLQMGSAVNQRVFDVPACGAFLLTDAQPSLDELFDAEDRPATYATENEIPELVRHYLKDEILRKDRVQKTMGRVLGYHTYNHRLSHMIEIMNKTYGV